MTRKVNSCYSQYILLFYAYNIPNYLDLFKTTSSKLTESSTAFILLQKKIGAGKILPSDEVKTVRESSVVFLASKIRDFPHKVYPHKGKRKTMGRYHSFVNADLYNFYLLREVINNESLIKLTSLRRNVHLKKSLHWRSARRVVLLPRNASADRVEEADNVHHMPSFFQPL